MKNINLYVNWFDHPNPERAKEFDTCLKRNFAVFDKVVVLKGRPTFKDMMIEFDDERINIIANLDIYFDESIQLVKWIKRDEVYCLTRWEDDGKGNIIPFHERHYGHPGEYSQDAWVFPQFWGRSLGAFCLGEPGCDNHLAYLLSQSLDVLNPSMDIKAIHLHNIERDSSHTRPRVGDGKYLPVKPCHL